MSRVYGTLFLRSPRFRLRPRLRSRLGPLSDLANTDSCSVVLYCIVSLTQECHPIG